MKNQTITYTDGPAHTKTQERTSGSAERCAGARFPEGRRGGGKCAHINARVLPGVLPALALVMFCALAEAAPEQGGPYQVLVLHSFRNSLPINTDWYDGLVQGFSSASDLRVEMDIESPDLSSLGNADYVSKLLDVYRHSYSERKPHLVIPTYTPALQFLLDHGESLFPGVPIVFLGADYRFVASRQLAPNVTGISSYLDFAGTLELALHVHPRTRRVAVIVGSGDVGRQIESDARSALQPFEDRLEFSWLRGLPLAELTEAVSKLPDDTVILYLAQLQDRTGKTYVPVNTLRDLSLVTNTPIYGLWDTLLEHGLIGGRMVTLKEDGFQAAQMALRILRGEAPAAVPVVHREGNRAVFHGPELARWNIGEGRLPADSRIIHRQLSFWEEYRTEITIAVLVIGIQGLLILALWLNQARLKQARIALQDEFNRRRQAEVVTASQRRRLAKFSKERTLGALATGIAHEINQPLIAIQNYAQAAKRRLHSDPAQTAKLNELFDKIEQQSGRAGDIIQHIRMLVTSDDAELRPVSLYTLLDHVTRIIGVEFETRGCRIDYRPRPDLPEVLADELQIQLVLVNLLLNAAQSMQSLEDKADKRVLIDIDPINDREVQVSVADRGPGIPADRLEGVFEPFYSDKVDGMGVGLAVCRDIIEAHGGRIWCTPNPSGGAIFRFTLRAAVE